MSARVIGSATVPWIPVAHRIDLVIGAETPVAHEVTSVFVFARDARARVLLTRVDRPGRGWEVPGGHVEAGESPRAAAARELAEEAGLAVAAGELVPFGGHRVALFGAPPPDYRYPGRAYQAAFVLRLPGPGPAVAPAPGSECAEAAWCDDDEVRERCAGVVWLPLFEAFAAGADR
ncbi:NUDIX hydrolase [Yinghuangia sp. ASG 101]|uniref:NUDIX domain-containing protein n=1 Tax=Yinghuangia sp. ASG 101 TaxID=2896848 RepID=UPI001E5547D8|nr:NUDIX hydrolase [Yinghuangia sp. ASG 101]UGQ13118.1 NUDIX hydrolase [Yinghuangia sp. ASG 101]